jgi:hypothetical protein
MKKVQQLQEKMLLSRKETLVSEPIPPSEVSSYPVPQPDDP